MPVPVLTSQQIRSAEERAMRHVSERTLMARAADAVAAEAEAILASRTGRIREARVAVLAGSGNNGGDALLAGARLHYRGAVVAAILVAGTAHELGLGECRAAGAAVIDAHDSLDQARQALGSADLIIDGIVGVGARPGLRSPAEELVAAIRDDQAVLAVDLPSGLNVDSGEVTGSHVNATVTVTFTAPKPCLVEVPAAASAGRIVVADVGVPRG